LRRPEDKLQKFGAQTDSHLSKVCGTQYYRSEAERERERERNRKWRGKHFAVMLPAWKVPRQCPFALLLEACFRMGKALGSGLCYKQRQFEQGT
jgi:hypothetical protein